MRVGSKTKLSWHLHQVSSCQFKSTSMAISGVREVRQFGAKGDGTGDDTEAVKKAIASLPQYGGVLYFPPGRLMVPPQITSRQAPSQQRYHSGTDSRLQRHYIGRSLAS